MPQDKAYKEAYNVALMTLTEIMLGEENYAAEDRIDAAEVILENQPQDKGEVTTNA